MSYMRPLDRRPRIQWSYTDTMELERQIALKKQQVRRHHLLPPARLQRNSNAYKWRTSHTIHTVPQNVFDG